MQPKLDYIKSKNFGEFWLVVDKFYHGKFYNKEYTKLLASFLNKLGAKDVLDAACGIGFPSLELSKFNFNLTCSDGDSSMVEIFKLRAAEEKLNIPIICAKWADLPKSFDNQFDAILCLDSSITYVDSWAKSGKLDVEKAQNSIRQSLEAFHQVIRKGGSLIVGLAKYAFDNKNNFEVDYGSEEIEGAPVNHKWLVSFNTQTKVKKWKIITKWDGKEDVREYESYMLLPQELEDLLKQAGFKNIRTENIVPGEYDYNFVAEK